MSEIDRVIRNVIIGVIGSLCFAGIILYWLYLDMQKQYGNGDFVFWLLGLCGVLGGLSIFSYIAHRKMAGPNDRVIHWTERTEYIGRGWGIDE